MKSEDESHLDHLWREVSESGDVDTETLVRRPGLDLIEERERVAGLVGVSRDMRVPGVREAQWRNNKSGKYKGNKQVNRRRNKCG